MALDAPESYEFDIAASGHHARDAISISVCIWHDSTTTGRMIEIYRVELVMCENGGYDKRYTARTFNGMSESMLDE